jgi:hypothetical protein
MTFAELQKQHSSIFTTEKADPLCNPLDSQSLLVPMLELDKLSPMRNRCSSECERTTAVKMEANIFQSEAKSVSEFFSG